MLATEGITFEPKDQWVRCLAHIINLAVQSALTSLKAVAANSEDAVLSNNETTGIISKVRRPRFDDHLAHINFFFTASKIGREHSCISTETWEVSSSVWLLWSEKPWTYRWCKNAVEFHKWYDRTCIVTPWGKDLIYLTLFSNNSILTYWTQPLSAMASMDRDLNQFMLSEADWEKVTKIRDLLQVGHFICCLVHSIIMVRIFYI